MSKQSQNPEADDRSRATPSTAGAGDILLAVARQERQRAEIQAKLNTMLDSLRSTLAVALPPLPSPVAVVPAPRAKSEPAAEVRARAIELFAQDDAPAPRRPATLEGSAAALKAKLDTLLEIENAIAFRAELRRELPEHLPAELQPAEPQPAEPMPWREALAVAPVPEAATAAVDAVPAWQGEIDRLNARLERMETASVMAATTLDSLMANFDAGQQNTFAAAQACAREEVRAAIAAEVQPALVHLRGASSHAQEEIHGVLSLLGTCLERVVQHLQKMEGPSAAGTPATAPEAPLPFVEAPAADPRPTDAPPSLEAPLLASSAPAVPLPGFGRRSKLAALIDFGFGTKAA